MKYCTRFDLYFVLMILFSGYGPASAQSDHLKGKIMDEMTGQVIDFGLVLNYSKSINIYTDKTGEFNLEVNVGDTLVLAALGFYYQKVIVTDSILNANKPVIFVMQPQAYEIAEAHIFPLGTYGEFRQKFINLYQPKTRTDILSENLAEISHKAAKEAYDEAQANRKLDGITFFSIPIRSPEEKERLALARIMEKEKRKNRIYQKFNPEVIRKVTGMTSEADIIEFMVFCRFSDHYLLEVNEYDLMSEIALKYEAFKRKKNALDSGEYPVNLKPGLANPIS